ncbi:hypothetical protein [Candidatus Protochlamydia sp. R18]|uniref:hypothetical protein n=1 Tax=Candidatus Protochlamydia sp. R18 TaxID=1353977 RepID=UPI0005A5FDD3|nr:hypothetical protein [Candidatus Protochlamydia sp. R18]
MVNFSDSIKETVVRATFKYREKGRGKDDRCNAIRKAGLKGVNHPEIIYAIYPDPHLHQIYKTKKNGAEEFY